MSSFYPHGGPAIYSYTKEFQEEHSRTGAKAFRNTSYTGLQEKTGMPTKALTELQALIAGARAAEIAFLRDTGIDLSQGANASTIFKSMNKIFNTQQTFSRALDYMKNISQANGNKDASPYYKEVSKFLDSYIDAAIKEVLPKVKKGLVSSKPIEDVVEEAVNEIISQALEQTYAKVKDFVDPKNGTIRLKEGQYSEAKGNEMEVTAINDMIETIQSLKRMGIFGKFGKLLNINTEEIKKELMHPNPSVDFERHKNFKIQTTDTSNGGNALELLSSAIAPELAKLNISQFNGEFGLQIQSVWSGQLNEMKADSFMVFSKVKLSPEELVDFNFGLTDSKSNRIQNQLALEDYLQRLGDNMEHIVAISDKNYGIGANFKGFHAQSKMRLDYAKEMLGNFKVGDVTKLVNYLANSGASMIQGGDGSDVRTALASYIGYFLFDHLEVEGKKTGVNVVNLINLSGMYIPLSVYLEGLYESLSNALHNYTSYVKVTISLQGPTEMSGSWSESTWTNFRKEHETESFIEYHVLRGVADFVTGLA